MATAPTLLSIDEYLRTNYRPDADFVDGEIEERNWGEYEHARLQWLIGAYFCAREKEWQIRGVTEQRIRVAPNRIRVCDLVLLRTNAPREKVTQTPPLLCIEVMSPEDRLAHAKTVLADYCRIGVQNIWLIDPIRRSAFTFDATGLHEAHPTKLFIANTPIHLDLTEAFAAID